MEERTVIRKDRLDEKSTTYDLIITLNLWLFRTASFKDSWEHPKNALRDKREDRSDENANHSRRLPGLGLEAVGAAPS